MGFLKYLFKSYGKDRINILSAYGSFFITISAVPFLALILFILSKLSPSLANEFENVFSNLVPEGLVSGFSKLIEQIKSLDFSSFLPISIIIAIWTSCKGVGGVCRGIELVYEKHDTGGFIFRFFKTIWRTLFFYIMIVLSLVIFSLGKILYSSTTTQGTVVNTILNIIIKLRVLAFFAILVLFFSILYARLYKSKNIFKFMPGGAFCALGWILFTFIYSMYISYSLNKPNIYLGMGSLVFFMLWIYFCVQIVLIGAQINKYCLDKKP